MATTPAMTRIATGTLASALARLVGRDPIDVEVEQLARTHPNIADGDPRQPTGVSQAVLAVAAEDAVHGRARVTEEWTEGDAALRAAGGDRRGSGGPRDRLRPGPTVRSSTEHEGSHLVNSVSGNDS